MITEERLKNSPQLRVICNELERKEEQALTADGYDNAIVGLSYDNRVVYDVDKCIAILQDRDGMRHEEAIEFFCFNTLRATDYEDPTKSPIFMVSIEEMENYGKDT